MAAAELVIPSPPPPPLTPPPPGSRLLQFGCYGAPLNTPSVTSFDGPRVIARVDFSGVVDTSAWVDFDSNWRAVTSVDGETDFYAVTDRDVRYVPTDTANASMTVLAATGNMRDVTILVHPITGETSVWANTNGGSVSYIGPTATANVPGPFSTMRLVPPPQALGVVHFSNHYTMFASDDSLGLLKYEVAPELRDGLMTGAAMAAATWTIVAGFPQRAAGFSVGLKALYGRVEGSSSFTTIYATTFAPSGNALVRYSEETNSWATLHVAAGGHMRAVFAADAVYSPSPSRSTSATATATMTTTASRSAVATPTPSRTAPATRSLTSSPSATASGSVSATSSETGSVSASGTSSASASATETGTPSASATETGTPSSSATPSGSASVSVTGTATGTGSRSAAATGSSSATATRTAALPTASSSKSRIALPSRTRSPTSTRTRSSSRTATRTRSRPRPSGTPTRTRSSKKKLRAL